MKRNIIIGTVIVIALLFVIRLRANTYSEELIYQSLPDWETFGFSKEAKMIDDFDVNIGNAFKIKVCVNTSQSSGVSVLFAKGPKESGHYELWMLDGKLAFYAPEINNGNAVYTDYYIADGIDHVVEIIYLEGKMFVSVDDKSVFEASVTGTIKDLNTSFCIGALCDGTFKFEGRLKNIMIYKYKDKETTPIEDKLLYRGVTDGIDLDTGNDSIVIKNFDANIGNKFTLSCVVKTSQSIGVSVLFAKGPKEKGHYEIWLFDGKLAYFSPDMNNGYAVYSNAFIADGKYHHIAFAYNGSLMYIYVDGSIINGIPAKGAVQNSVNQFSIGSLIDGGFEYAGFIADIRIYNYVLSTENIKEMIPDYVDIKNNTPYTPIDRVSTYEPLNYSLTRALRGVERLMYMQALPYIDVSATTGYEGSIDKNGGNADWNWSIYQDNNDEWVLFETYGAGCIYNFTQHRYPTSEEPTFCFYFDQGDKPTFSIKQSEFGKKAPFLKPLSDIYEGPEDNGRGPIWVVRSFVPMPFKTYCKVTSSVKLEGYEKANGEGGWGHIDYVLYDTAGNIETFKKDTDYSVINKLTNNLTFDPKYNKENEVVSLKNVTVKADTPLVLLEKKATGSIAGVKIILEGENATPDNLQDLRIRMYWDNHKKADVDAPIGTFFGNEYGYTDCDNALLMVGNEIKTGIYFKGYNYFPMPFWESVKIELYTVGERNLNISDIEISITPETVCKYNKSMTGYFVSSDYYEKTANVAGKNTVIAEMNGIGHMVYGVLSGYDINSGCEGDVRVFFDNRQTPEMESDGTESWASYGWGFVTPPQSNPFSGYSGLYNSNAYWSVVRLTLGDSYFFKKSLRFELEHGGANDGMGSHSGQIFCYMLDTDKESEITDSIYMWDEESLRKHEYEVEGKYDVLELNSAYENGVNIDNVFSKKLHGNYTGSYSFKMKIDSNNNGIVLLRTSSQANRYQAAKVYIDGIEVKDRVWYYADTNMIYSWFDDSFQIPSSYTKGKELILVKIEPVNKENNTWNASGFSVLNIYEQASSKDEILLSPITLDKIRTVLYLLVFLTLGITIDFRRKRLKRSGC